MYLGRFKFIIEKDTSQVLLPCDIIESLTFGFTVGKNALFRIWRNNILYPDEKLHRGLLRPERGDGDQSVPGGDAATVR